MIEIGSPLLAGLTSAPSEVVSCRVVAVEVAWLAVRISPLQPLSELALIPVPVKTARQYVTPPAVMWTGSDLATLFWSSVLPLPAEVPPAKFVSALQAAWLE